MLKYWMKRFVIMPGMFQWLQRKDRLPVLMYHGVYPAGPLSPASFRRQMVWLARRFTTLWASEIPTWQAEGAGRPCVVLTFDDGLANAVRWIAPVLNELKLKATMYVCPGLLDADEPRLLWNHELRLRLSRLTPHQRAESFGMPLTQTEVEAVEALKHCPMSEARRWLASARALGGELTLTDDERERFQLMDAAQVAALPENFEVGCHSLDHPILDQLDEDRALYDQIVVAKERLTSRINRPVETFCYPNGRTTAPIHRLVSRHYRVALTTQWGMVKPGDDPWQLPRISAAGDFTQFRFNLVKPG